MEKDGKRRTKIIGCKVIPRSHPLFQEFKIWQTLNDIEVSVVDRRTKHKQKEKSSTLFSDMEEILEVEGKRYLYQEEKELLAKELFVRKYEKSGSVKFTIRKSKGIGYEF